MAESTNGEGATGGYASVNDLDMYYEIHGTGEPLVLLHGGFGVIGIFAAFEQLLPALATTRQVIAVEMQGHGRTADIERPLAFEQMADDVAALITHLGLEQVDLCGYSLGGGVALQTAIRHPEVVRKLVVASAPCKRNGWYPEDLAGMAMITAEAMARTPMYAAYLSVAPNPEDWTRLANNMRQLLGRDYDWSAQVAALTAPTLIVIGDADGVRPEHAIEMLRLRGGGKAHGVMDELPQSQLAVLPGTTHASILTRTDLLLPIITPFLDAPMPAAMSETPNGSSATE